MTMYGGVCALLCAKYQAGMSTDNDDKADNDDNDTRRAIHDYIGSLVFMPNEPKNPSEEMGLTFVSVDGNVVQLGTVQTCSSYN